MKIKRIIHVSIISLKIGSTNIIVNFLVKHENTLYWITVIVDLLLVPDCSSKWIV